jgi:hypothetical protein
MAVERPAQARRRRSRIAASCLMTPSTERLIGLPADR